MLSKLVSTFDTSQSAITHKNPEVKQLILVVVLCIVNLPYTDTRYGKRHSVEGDTRFVQYRLLLTDCVAKLVLNNIPFVTHAKKRWNSSLVSYCDVASKRKGHRIRRIFPALTSLFLPDAFKVENLRSSYFSSVYVVIMMRSFTVEKPGRPISIQAGHDRIIIFTSNLAIITGDLITALVKVHF